MGFSGTIRTVCNDIALLSVDLPRTGATVTVQIRDDQNGVSETVISRLAEPVSSTNRQFISVTVIK